MSFNRPVQEPRDLIYRVTLASIRKGAKARRASWPEGAVVFFDASNFPYIFKSENGETRAWHPSEEEQLANDWSVVS